MPRACHRSLLLISTLAAAACAEAVSAPSPAVTQATHEPAGFTRITERGFDAFIEDGWIVESGLSLIAIESDSTAPQSPGGVLRVEYPAGYHAGTGPVDFEKSTNAHTRNYLSFWFRLSENFQGENSRTNKLFFNWIHNNPSAFLSAEGVGSGTLRPTFRLQNVADTREYLYPNVVPAAEITRGRWHHWEVLFIANEPGVPNGTARWWFDDELVGDYTDILFSTKGQGNRWQLLELSPIWGGVNGTVARDMELWVDHVYLSGSNQD